MIFLLKLTESSTKHEDDMFQISPHRIATEEDLVLKILTILQLENYETRKGKNCTQDLH